ncbi:E3 ubiquitin-protein ligase listerin isoform X2 [Sphaerodactylus townsendi]|uniref:E3 ubiquitin-protein ligase listerin isoform X2 n=1 Tax=Sphaerodactylus townsendi TaxID=933632 RepID=UPI002026A097|nr:E3 ubiquitin-protein ligase listerin isoform X2 [Sphaerodactylus townsendi]
MPQPIDYIEPPSSSGRAAELLAKERGTVPGFIGFGSSSDLGYVPAVQGAEEIDSLVDADFRMVLRKLSKRDVITKLKAMQEFGTMCKERETETVKGVLPYWSRIYCKISLDHDRRVREATQQAFEHLILKVKKNLAPHLKNLMGHWLIAQCDTYSPAASAATAAFEKAFPPSKQPEALVFCKDEILNVLQDHLLKETPNTLSDPQTVPEEEREAKFFRILTCSLLALKKLLCLLPSSENCLLEEKLKPLLSQNKFWKYGKHSNPQVRSAFFEVISALCQYAPESVKADASRACPAVLLSIDDSDAIVCPALWEAVLHVLATIEDCWIHVNVKKGVLPKLWILLQEGGRGLATIIYPNLLPFISKVPDDVIEPKLDFYRTFFTSMIQGMLTERATASRSECSAILSAFMECFRFTILQNGGEGGGIRIQEMLLNEQLIPLIDMVIKEPRLQNGPLFYEVADLLSSWETRTDSSSCEETTLTFQRMLSNFWDGLSKVCVVHVDVIDADEKALAAVSCLLQILQNPENKMKPSKRKAVKIRFSEEVEAGNSTENEKDVNLRSSNKPGTIFHAQDLSPLRKEPLEDLVCTLAELSIVYTGAQRSDQHLKFLSALLSSFASQRVFQVLLGSRNNIQEAVKPQYENPSLQFLYENVIDWLKEDWRKETDFLVDILYSVLHCCSSTTEKENILNGLTKMDLRWKILLQIIQKACSSSEKYSLVSCWLKGSVLGEKLVTLADDLCNSSLKTTVASVESFHSEEWALLSLVLSQLIKNESLIGEVYIKRIIDILQAALSKAKDLSEAGNSEASVSFICDIASNFFSSVKGCLLMPSSEDLLFTIFQLCAKSQNTTYLSDFLVNKLKHTWLCGLMPLAHQLGDMHKESTFLRRSAFWVKNQLQSTVMDIKSLQVLISAVSDLLTALLEADEVSAYILKDYIEWLTPSTSEWEKMRESLSTEWLKKPLLEGRLSMNCQISGTDLGLCVTDKLPSYLWTTALLSKVTLLILGKGVFESQDMERSKLESIIAEQLYALQWIEELANPSCLLLEFLHDLQAMNVSLEKLSVLSNIPCLLQILFNRSKENGKLWALTLAKLINAKNISRCEIKALFNTTERFFPLTEGTLHTLQNLSPFLLEEDKEDLVIQCTAKLMTCNKMELSETDGPFGYLAILNSCLSCGRIDCGELMPGILKIIMSWRHDYEDIFLFSCNLKEASSQLLGFNTEMIRFLSLLLKSPSSLLDSEWDFVMCSMLAWLETTSESQAVFSIALVQVFVCVSCDLATALSVWFQAVTSENTEKLPPNLLSEWQEFFSEGIHSLLLPLMVKITRDTKNASEISFQNSVLKSLGEALMFVSKDQLLNHKLPAKFVASQKTNLPDEVQTLLNTLSPLLLFRARSIQITVYHMLNKLMSDLPEFDNKDLRSYGDEEEELSLSPPAALMTILVTQEDLLENILECIPVGEFAVIQPLSEEFCLVLGYLLTWKLILTFFKAASSQLRALYSQYLRRTKSLNKLLYHLFRLMPENPAFPGSTAEFLNKDTKTYFTEGLNLDIKDTSMLSSEIPHLACSVYCMTLKDLPAMVRLWWNSCEKRVFSIVDKFTSKYVSNILSSQEISSVQTSTQLFNGMMVKARSATREVIATYSVDDIFIELIIQLPPNYPLGSIAVESGKRVGVAVQQWRNWMLQLSTYLTHQNGSIMEGLALWKNNVDKRFEGVEDCMICFSVIHGSNYSLPKKACRTCKKKFHSACLYKWFTSSNKSTCPLCRETFF